MNRLVNWVWRRWRGHFLLAQLTFAFAGMTFGILLPILIIVVWLGVPVTELGPPAFVGAATSVITLAVGASSSLADLRQVQRWIDGDHSNPVATRDAALLGPERMTQRGSLRALPVWLPGNTWAFGDVLGVSGTGWAAIALMTVYVWTLGSLVMGTAIRLLADPLLDEVHGAIETNPAPAGKGVSIQTRFVWSIFCAAMGAATATAGAAYRWGSSVNAVVVVGFGVAAVMSAYVTLTFLAGVVRPSLRPLHDLSEATRRVRAGDFSQSVPLTSADEFGDLVQSFNEMTVGLRQREALQAAFGSYVDPALARRLLSEGSDVFAGESVEVSVFFADVRGFTTFAASVQAEEAVTELNRLFAVMVPAIRDAGGHPNHYTGDGVLAVFGTPEPLVDHADAAVKAAVTIQREIRRVFADTLRLGIGINTGKVIAGTVGAPGKLDFTVIGDVVNVAARVEEHTKQTGDSILLTRTTLDALRTRPNTVPRGPVALRGKATAVELFALDI